MGKRKRTFALQTLRELVSDLGLEVDLETSLDNAFSWFRVNFREAFGVRKSSFAFP